MFARKIWGIEEKKGGREIRVRRKAAVTRLLTHGVVFRASWKRTIGAGPRSASSLLWRVGCRRAFMEMLARKRVPWRVTGAPEERSGKGPEKD